MYRYFRAANLGHPEAQFRIAEIYTDKDLASKCGVAVNHDEVHSTTFPVIIRQFLIQIE